MTICFSLLLFFCQAFAAIPTHKKSSSDMLAYEILSMPEQNRNQVALYHGEKLLPQLLKISKESSQSMETRWKALTLAALVGKEKSIPALEEAMKAPEWFLRNAALVSMQKYHPAKAKSAATSLLKDKALVVRSAAVEALGAVADRRTRDLLWEELSASYNYRKKQGLWIRGQIIGKLASHPVLNEAPLFLRALRDQDSRLHLSAIGALEKLTSKQLGKPQQKLAEKRELWLQWAKAHPQFTVN